MTPPCSTEAPSGALRPVVDKVCLAELRPEFGVVDLLSDPIGIIHLFSALHRLLKIPFVGTTIGAPPLMSGWRVLQQESERQDCTQCKNVEKTCLILAVCKWTRCVLCPICSVVADHYVFRIVARPGRQNNLLTLLTRCSARGYRDLFASRNVIAFAVGGIFGCAANVN